MKITAPRSSLLVTVATASALLSGACGGRSDDAGAVSVDGAWARTSPMSSTAGAVYFDITSEEADVLVGVSVDAGIAAEAQIHETSMMAMDDDDAMEDEMADDAMEDEMADGSDVMRMQEIESLELPAGESVELAPGGFHIMLLDLAEALENGDTFDLTLDFETAPDKVISIQVGDSAPE